MKDALLDFGSMTLATKTTAVYSQALDFGTLSGFTTHTTGMDKPADIVVRTAVAFNAADNVIITVQDSADDSTFLDLYSGVLVEAPGIGVIQILPMPTQHRRYVRIKAYPNSSGTFTETAITAYIEPGANRTL